MIIKSNNNNTSQQYNAHRRDQAFRKQDVRKKKFLMIEPLCKAQQCHASSGISTAGEP